MSEAKDLPAGRELDALVAEKVMGWKRRRIVECYPGMVGVPLDDPRLDDYWWTSDNRPTNEIARDEGGGAVGECNECGKVYGAWSPSTDIAAAWTVVEKLRSTKHTDPEWDQRWDWKVAVVSIQPGQHGCRVFRCGPGHRIFDTEDIVAQAIDGTEMLAICRAALKAVGHVD